jgi:DHA1 family tetracycline resistance protein-like MFS transporter
MATQRKAALGFILVTVLLDVMGMGIIIPVMPKLVSHLTGGGMSEAARWGGWMVFAYALMLFVCSPLMGGLSDRFGRRPVLLASLFGFGIDYLFMAFAPTIGWLFVGRAIAGMMGASMTTCSAYIADSTPPEKRAQSFGLIGAVFAIGLTLGPLLGGLLGSFGPRAPFIAAAVLTLLNWLYGLLILPESLAPANRRPFDWRRANPVGSLRNLARYPVIAGLASSLVLVQIAVFAVNVGWPYYTIEKFGWNERMIGASLAVVGLATGLVQGGLVRLAIPKLGLERCVYTGLGFYAVGYFLFAAATRSWMMFAFTFIYCLGGIAGPALQGIVSTQVPPNAQGELQGGLISLLSLTAIAGPPIMTNVFSYFTGPTAPFYFPGAALTLGGILIMVSAVLARSSLRRTRAVGSPSVAPS